MQKNHAEARVMNAMLVAPLSGASCEVAAYATSNGILVSNADIRPYDPVSGQQLQLLSKKPATFGKTQLAKMVKVGHCTACDNNLLATATKADELEVAGKDFSCLFCAAPVTPVIAQRDLLSALANEFGEDDEDTVGDPEDAPNDFGGDAEDEPSDDEQYDEDEDDGEDGDYGDEDVPEDDEQYDDGEDVPDEDGEDAPEDDADDGTDGDGDEDDEQYDEGDEDGEMPPDEDAPPEGEEDPDDADAQPVEDAPHNEGDEEFTAAVAAVRKRMTELGMTLPATAAHRRGERPVAGKRVERADIDEMNQDVRAALRERASSKVDGNKRLKSTTALAAGGDSMSGEDGITPGTNATEGEMNKQLGTPGSTDKAPEDPKKQPLTPGTADTAAATSGDVITDWKSSKINIVAIAGQDDLWVFANGAPVGQLIKSQATDQVQFTWNHDVSLMEKAFVAVARRGLPEAEAVEFGFSPHKFIVAADKVMLNTFRRQKETAAVAAKSDAERQTAAYRQSLEAATTAVLKGYGAKNPMRDALVATLERLGVAEPRGVVDTAMAASVDAFAVAVLQKATEIAAKSDEARNEYVANLATAAYQARVDVAAQVAAHLAAGSERVVAAAVGQSVTQEAYKAPTVAPTDRSEAFKGVLRTIARR